MGICPLFSKPTPNQDTLSSTLKSNILDPDKHLTVKLNTPNDNNFLYFTQYWDLEHVLNTVLEDKRLLRSEENLIREYLGELKGYLREFGKEGSGLARKLEGVCGEGKEKGKGKEKGYACLEIQSVLLREKVKEIEIDIICQIKNQQTLLQTTTLKSHLKTDTFEVNKCWNLNIDPLGFLVIRINKLKSTSILLKQVNLSLAVAEVLNLRRGGILQAVGEISLRLECVKDSQDWKLKTSRMLKMRQKQLEKLLEECPKIEPGVPSGQKVFIRSSLSERPVSKNYSYYQPSEFEAVEIRNLS